MDDLNPQAKTATTQSLGSTGGKGEKKMEGIDPGLVALMKENGNDDKTLWLFLLLLLYGKDGFGGGGDGRCCPPVTLEQLNDAQNAVQNQLQNTNQNANDHFLQASDTAARNQLSNETNAMAIQGSIASAHGTVMNGQKDITAAIAQCCCDNLLSQKDTQKAIELGACETTRAIEKCCCETQNSIALQTNTLATAICEDGNKTRALITDNRMQDLQAQLQICRDENSNLRQTELLSQRIREACCQPCQPCHPHPHGNGGGPPGPPMV